MWKISLVNDYTSLTQISFRSAIETGQENHGHVSPGHLPLFSIGPKGIGSHHSSGSVLPGVQPTGVWRFVVMVIEMVMTMMIMTTMMIMALIMEKIGFELELQYGDKLMIVFFCF